MKQHLPYLKTTLWVIVTLLMFTIPYIGAILFIFGLYKVWDSMNDWKW
jgi:hypothetical protein